MQRKNVVEVDKRQKMRLWFKNANMGVDTAKNSDRPSENGQNRPFKFVGAAGPAAREFAQELRVSLRLRRREFGSRPRELPRRVHDEEGQVLHLREFEQ